MQQKGCLVACLGGKLQRGSGCSGPALGGSGARGEAQRGAVLGAGDAVVLPGVRVIVNCFHKGSHVVPKNQGKPSLDALRKMSQSAEGKDSRDAAKEGEQGSGTVWGGREQLLWSQGLAGGGVGYGGPGRE